MNRMKMLALLTFALLLLCAFGQAAHASYDVPQSIVVAPYLTPTGKTIIEIDAEISMPVLNELAVYQVKPRAFNESEIQQLVKGFGFPDGTQIRQQKLDDSGSVYKGYSMDIYKVQSGKQIMHLFNEYMQGKPSGASIKLEQANARIEFSPDDWLLPYASDISPSDADMLEKSRRAANELASQIAPDLQLNAEGRIRSAPIFFGDKAPVKSESVPVTYAYMFIFSRTLQGVPVTITGTRMGTFNEFMPSLPEEQLSIILSDNELNNARYFSPYQLEKGNSIDTKDLLPFDKVLDIAKTTLPLMRLSQESPFSSTEKQERLTINRIAFGYVRVNAKNQPGLYQLVPAWDFFGSFTMQGRVYEGGKHTLKELQQDYAINSFLTVNAVTGEVIDRTLGY